MATTVGRMVSVQNGLATVDVTYESTTGLLASTTILVQPAAVPTRFALYKANNGGVIDDTVYQPTGVAVVKALPQSGAGRVFLTGALSPGRSLAGFGYRVEYPV